MAARANLVLKDRATPTPLDHTFTPDGDDANGVHVWSEKEPNGVAAGAKRLTASMRRDPPTVIVRLLKLRSRLWQLR